MQSASHQRTVLTPVYIGVAPRFVDLTGFVSRELRPANFSVGVENQDEETIAGFFPSAMRLNESRPKYQQACEGSDRTYGNNESSPVVLGGRNRTNPILELSWGDTL
jgi:hypothetical protein